MPIANSHFLDLMYSCFISKSKVGFQSIRMCLSILIESRTSRVTGFSWNCDIWNISPNLEYPSFLNRNVNYSLTKKRSAKKSTLRYPSTILKRSSRNECIAFHWINFVPLPPIQHSPGGVLSCSSIGHHVLNARNCGLNFRKCEESHQVSTIHGRGSDNIEPPETN